MPNPLDALDRVIDKTVAPNAARVDRDATFPGQSIDALAGAGLLSLTSAIDAGGAGLGLAEAAEVIERLARACGSTAMVVLMHYAAVSIVEAYGSKEVRGEIGDGQHLTSLAFSESGSRSHFWAPLGTARPATKTGGSSITSRASGPSAGPRSTTRKTTSSKNSSAAGWG